MTLNKQVFYFKVNETFFNTVESGVEYRQLVMPVLGRY
jgi:hypothetical protein